MSSKIYLIPHFHYDVVYCKTYEEYLETSLANLVEMLNIMESSPEYRFLIEQVILLQEFWYRFPEHRAGLKELFKEGRIEVGCGMFVMPDMTLVSGESLIRQAESGKKWVREHLGSEVVTCWIADCWGHHRQLPQILTKCGYKYYAFSRAMRLDATDRSEFFWEGLDGSRILTHWMSVGYDALFFHGYTYKPLQEEMKGYSDEDIDPLEFDLARMAEQLKKVSGYVATDVVLLPDGLDFGRPQVYAPERVRKWNESEVNIPVSFACPRDFFAALEKKKEQIPVISADFNPAFPGTYCSRIEIKQYNRKLENLLQTAEALSSCAAIEGAFNQDQNNRLREAERLMLYNQFHDIICGSFIDEVYPDTMSKYQKAEGLTREAISESIDILTEKVLQKGDNLFLFVFNSLSCARKDVVKAKVSIYQDGVESIRLYDDKGKEVPIQVIDKKTVLRKDVSQVTELTFIFPAEISAVGYRFYRVEFDSQERKSKKISSSNIPLDIETEFFNLKISKHGVIKSLILKDNHQELVDRERPYFNDLVFQLDQGDFWQYYQAPVNAGLRTAQALKDPYPEKDTPLARQAVHSKDVYPEIKLLEQGPVRTTVQIKGKVNSWAVIWEFIQYIYLYEDIKRIDFRTEFIPQGRHYRLRVCFPTSIKDGRIRQEIPFGYEERPEGEYSVLNWVDYEDKEKGLCLVNKGLPGNNITDGVMMLSLFRAVDMGPNKYKSEGGFAEGTKQVFEYSLIPFIPGSSDYHPYHCGQEVNSPLIARPVRGKGKNDRVPRSYFSVTPANVVISSLKMTSGGVLCRLYEAEGRESHFEITLPPGVVQVVETDCLGERQMSCRISKGKVSGIIGRFEIKTFRLSLWELPLRED